MPISNHNQEDQTPLPAVAEPTEAKPPQGGWRRYRALIICGLILAFIIYIFAAKEYQGVEQASSPAKIVAKEYGKALNRHFETRPEIKR